MITFQIEVGNQVIDVTYEPYNAHEPFGEGGYYINNVILSVDLTNIRGNLQSKHSIKESFKQALSAYELLEHFERDECQTYVCDVPHEFDTDFDYLHQLEGIVTKIALMLMKQLGGLNYHTKSRFP